ncbi:hypothetical protein HK099_006230 [Clydaea vesicula]|uniref:Peptidase S59 domain-containing protein n=1 Tax=Clydaea vesicula TaxID=447962 RepID=A0AAD5TXU3_9FUNG|nr:hypothetical protein HK099_006230 [Clydaea vesicula]
MSLNSSTLTNSVATNSGKDNASKDSTQNITATVDSLNFTQIKSSSVPATFNSKVAASEDTKAVAPEADTSQIKSLGIKLEDVPKLNNTADDLNSAKQVRKTPPYKVQDAFADKSSSQSPLINPREVLSVSEIGLLVLKSDKSTATPPQPFRMTPKSSAKLKLRGISQSPISVTSNIQHTNKSYNSKNGGLELETLSESLKEVEETFILSKSNEMDSLSTTHPKASQVYEVKPNISELKKMRDEELKCVENFEVSVPKVGKIKWLQPVDILKIVKSGNGIESIFEDEIIIEQNSATVYPNANTKPNVGSELNTPCLITLFNMWPKDRSNMIAIKDLKDFRMENYLRRLKSVPDTKFKNYDVNLGAWTFVVQHFTKYGFDDDASEMETEEFGNDSSYAINDSFANIKSRKGKQREKVHHLVYHENILDDLENNSNFLEGAKNEKKHLETFFGDEVIISKINEETDDFEEDEEQVDMYEEQPNNRSEFNDINLAIENEGFEADLLEDGIAVDESDESEDLSEQQVADEDGAHSASPSDTPQSEKSLKRMLQTKLSVPHSFKAVKVQQMGQAFFRKEVQIKTPITSKRSEAVALQEDSDIADNGSVALTKYLERDAENKPKTPFNKRYTPVATTPSLSELRLFEKSSSDHLNMQNFYKRMENIQGGSPYKINFTKKNQIPVIQKGYLQKRFNNGKVIKSMEGILDGSLSFGRSFRVGWGRAGQLITCGSLDHGRNNVNFSLVNIVKLDVFNDQLLELEKLKHEKLLNCLLRHTFINRVKLDENKYASADPKNVNDTILNQPAENFDFAVSINSAVGFKDLAGEVSNVLNNSTNVSVHTIFDEQEKVLWDLCSALWDTTDLDNELTASLNEKQIVATNESSRKEDVSGWLKNALKANVNKLVQEAKQKEDSSKIIFSLLSGREIGRATMEAIFAKNFKLSLILSQIGGPSSRVGRNSEYGPSGHGAPGRMGTDEALRELIAKQVEIWEKIKHDIVAFNKSKVVFNEELFCCWKLISGIFKDADIFSIIKQDWKRTFGCFLWYGDGGLWSLKKAFQSFCSLVESGRNVSYPYPKYIETLSASEQAIVLNKIKGLTGVDTAPKDSIYNILKFYSVQDFKIEEALKPEGFSINLLDVRQPWFLSTFLSHRRDSVEGSKQLPNNVENYLAVSFAFELESLGLWKYCCFVAMFLNNIVEKERMIKYYLSKFFDYKDFSSSCARDFFEDSLKKDDSEEFRFLVKKLRIPLNWIFEAKILKARNANDVFFEVTALIDAGYYSAAHRTILLKVAPFAVINSDYVILEKLLALIQGRKIDCWEIGGSILLQFIKIENFTNDYLNKFDMLDDNLNNLKNSLSEEDFFEEMRKYDIRKRTLIVELKEKFSVKEVLNLCFKSLIKQKRDMVLKKKFLFVNGSNTAYSIKELKSNLLHLTAVFTEINSKLAALIFKLDNHIPNFKDEIDMGEIQSLSLNGHERLSIYNYQFSSFINESLEK